MTKGLAGAFRGNAPAFFRGKAQAAEGRPCTESTAMNKKPTFACILTLIGAAILASTPAFASADDGLLPSRDGDGTPASIRRPVPPILRPEGPLHPSAQPLPNFPTVPNDTLARGSTTRVASQR